MEESVRRVFALAEPRLDTVPVLTLAFLGDSVFELIVRTALAGEQKDRGQALNMRVQAFSAARGQARMTECFPDILTEEELAVYRRGKNAHPDSTSRHATLSEYHKATGLEALMGWLYLKGRTERAAEIIRQGMEYIRGEKGTEA